MLPTLYDELETVLVEHYSTTKLLGGKNRGLKQGDIVVFTSPKNPKKVVSKRVIGLVSLFALNSRIARDLINACYNIQLAR